MRVIVYGAGAVGGAFAIRLAQGGHDVTVVARGAHLDAIRARGLELDDGATVVRRNVAALGPGETMIGSPPDVMLVTLKATALHEAATHIASLADRAPVIFAANGLPWWLGRSRSGPLAGWRSERLDPGRALERAMAERAVLGGVIFSGNLVTAPGMVRNTSPGANRLAIGPAGGGSPPDDLARALSVGGLEVVACADPAAPMWRKLLFNVAFSPLSVAAGVSQGELLAHPGLAMLARRMAEEALAIARAAGADLPDDAADALFADHRTQAAHKSSMLQDFEAGRPLELDAILGALIELGASLGQPAARLESAHAIVSARARKQPR